MKKTIKIILTLICIILSILIIIYFSQATYTIKVKKVDTYSPDRTLEVYRNNKEIDYKEIYYEDDTLLCYSSNPTVAYTDLIGEEKFLIILKNNKKVTAKIIED